MAKIKETMIIKIIMSKDGDVRLSKESIIHQNSKPNLEEMSNEEEEMEKLTILSGSFPY